MQKRKVLKRIAQGFIFVSALALLAVGVMAFNDPQSVMDLMGVEVVSKIVRL